MMDVLKLAEEALEMYRLHVQHNHVTYYGDEYNKERQEQATAREYVTSDKPHQAMTAIRAARAEWGWLPIAEMAEIEPDPVYVAIAGDHPLFVSRFTVVSKRRAVDAGYTHFYRPQVPPPPTREEVGNG